MSKNIIIHLIFSDHNYIEIKAKTIENKNTPYTFRFKKKYSLKGEILEI